MTAAVVLALISIALLLVTFWLMFTNDLTDEERDAMLRDEEMWP
jgi:hypothetical protein